VVSVKQQGGLGFVHESPAMLAITHEQPPAASTQNHSLPPAAPLPAPLVPDEVALPVLLPALEDPGLPAEPLLEDPLPVVAPELLLFEPQAPARSVSTQRSTIR